MKITLQEYAKRKNIVLLIKREFIQALEHSFVARLLFLQRQSSVLSGSFFFSTFILASVQITNFFRSFLSVIPNKKLLLIVLLCSVFITFQILYYISL